MKKMHKMAAAALTLIALVGLFAVPAAAQPKEGSGYSMPVFSETGNTFAPFYVSVGTITAAQVYTKPAGRVDRVFKICNTEAFDLFVATFSAANATTSPGVSVPQNGCLEINSPSKSLWAIYESAAGAADRVTGYVQYDSRD